MGNDITATLNELPAPRSLWSQARRRFWRNHLAVIGLILLVLLLLSTYGSLPLWLKASSTSPTAPAVYALQNLSNTLASPAPGHWLGTDRLGRDLLARLMVGGAVSLAIGLASAAIAVGIGTTVGLVAGYVGGRVDAVLMRLVDILYGLPYILLVILMRVALVKPLTLMFKQVFGDALGRPDTWANILVLLVGIGSVSWLTMARVIRGQTLALRDQPFVEAARALGLNHATILRCHILPNLVGPIVVYATLTVPQAILSESFLSFLGLGIQEPLPSWGKLASDGVDAFNPIHIYWWLLAWPCVALSGTLLCLNFVGDGLRDALDPKGSR